MVEYYLMICTTCKAAEWKDKYEIPDYIAEHTGHVFSLLPDDALEDLDDFLKWFLKFMDWSEEAEG